MKRRSALVTALAARIAVPALMVSLLGIPPAVHADVPESSLRCVACHGSPRIGAPGLVAQWENSRHAEEGVGCFDCHASAEGRPDSFVHNGYSIVTIVTPNDCGACHSRETDEFLASRHADAASFIGSLDNTLGEIVEGTAAATSGCRQCHGSVVSVDEGGRIDPATWPNTGMGRINPDGSRGSCSACHTRHGFSRAQARMPENCGRCHMGPDHPHIEIYNESKHGIAFAAARNTGEMNLDADEWVVGRDYSAAPTCATCHMSATPSEPVTHDVGARISWTLRPVVSTHLDNWEERRDSMVDVCRNCHMRQFVENFYTQFDEAVGLYNEKFALPAREIMDYLHENDLITPTPFDDEIEFTFFELWHHEGRRARMGASMMGPDYTQWHGFYEVAKNFYTEFLEEARELGADEIVDEVLSRPEHRWREGLSQDEIEARIEFYHERYGE